MIRFRPTPNRPIDEVIGRPAGENHNRRAIDHARQQVGIGKQHDRRGVDDDPVELRDSSSEPWPSAAP